MFNIGVGHDVFNQITKEGKSIRNSYGSKNVSSTGGCDNVLTVDFWFNGISRGMDELWCSHVGLPGAGAVPLRLPLHGVPAQRLGERVREKRLVRFPDLAMGQNPVPPVNIPIPTKIGSKMGGAPTPKWY